MGTYTATDALKINDHNLVAYLRFFNLASAQSFSIFIPIGVSTAGAAFGMAHTALPLVAASFACYYFHEIIALR